jgi:ABC-2 type transport system permease protein
MNIFKRELRAGLKPFLFWTLGLFFLVFIGMTKSIGLSAGGGPYADLADAFPRLVVAMMGLAGVDIGTFGGFYAVLAQYAAILTAVYAVWLGNAAVSRESVDKTYEFVFTKPRSRSFILAQKLMAGFVPLTAYCALDCVFSAAAKAAVPMDTENSFSFLPFAAGTWLTGLVFFSLAALFAAAAKNAERGSRFGNAAILICYALGVVYDMLENGGLVLFFTPFRYFAPDMLLRPARAPLRRLCLIVSAALCLSPSAL